MIDGIHLSPPGTALPDTWIDTSFSEGADGFGYVDDAFRGTNEPGYASGAYLPGGGFAASCANAGSPHKFSQPQKAR